MIDLLKNKIYETMSTTAQKCSSSRLKVLTRQRRASLYLAHNSMKTLDAFYKSPVAKSTLSISQEMEMYSVQVPAICARLDMAVLVEQQNLKY